jgi:hypothetical protein
LQTAPRPSAADRLTRRALFLLGLAGAVLLVDGALRGELRHRLVGVVGGAALLLPLATSVAVGPRALRLWRKVLLSALVLLVGLLVVEVAARVLDLSALSVAELERDPVLGHVHRPDRGGMDAGGFRNPSVPARADVVCVGDSQTFGANIRAEDTWPRALERRSGLAVHNLSLGGYGPIQYLALTQRALELAPRVVVVGFFLGNDLSDAHRFAGLERWAALRDPQLAYAVPDDVPRGDTRSLNLAMALVDGVQARSRLVGSLAERLKLQLKVNPALAGLFRSGDQPERFLGGDIGTYFTPGYRLGSVDLERADVRDGLRISGLCLDEMGALCRERNVQLVLLLLPTKEAVYARFLTQHADAPTGPLQALAAAEQEAAEAVRSLARERGVPVVDPTDELLAALADDVACWPPNSDGHFNPQGCERVATALWRDLAARLERGSQDR